MSDQKWKWLYTRDFATLTLLYEECKKWHSLGYRVFIQGYSAADCKEYKP